MRCSGHAIVDADSRETLSTSQPFGDAYVPFALLLALFAFKLKQYVRSSKTSDQEKRESSETYG